MKRAKLQYQDFTPLYINGKRTHRYVSPSTGEVISKRQFQQSAHGGISLEKKAARNKNAATKQPLPKVETSTPPTATNKQSSPFTPLYTNGKRDKKYRYVNTTTGEVISSSTFYRKSKSTTPTVTATTDSHTVEKPSSSTLTRPADTTLSEHRRQVNNSRENILKTYTDKLNRDARIYGLPLITEKEAAKQAEFKFILRALKTKDNSAKGKKAQALVLLGLRDPEWTNDVGSS